MREKKFHKRDKIAPISTDTHFKAIKFDLRQIKVQKENKILCGGKFRFLNQPLHLIRRLIDAKSLLDSGDNSKYADLPSGI